jgi:hypothetical protein
MTSLSHGRVVYSAFSPIVRTCDDVRLRGTRLAGSGSLHRKRKMFFSTPLEQLGNATQSYFIRTFFRLSIRSIYNALEDSCDSVYTAAKTVGKCWVNLSSSRRMEIAIEQIQGPARRR